MRPASPSIAAIAALAVLILPRAAGAEDLRDRAVDLRLGTPLVGGVSYEGGDDDIDSSVRLDAAYLFRGGNVTIGPVASIWRWSNPETSRLGGGAATLLGVGGLLEVHGRGRGGPFARLGAGLALGFVAEELSMEYPDDRAVQVVSTTGAGVTWELSPGWRIALGPTTHLTLAVGVRGASIWHRTETMMGNAGSLSERPLALLALDASIGVGFEI